MLIINVDIFFKRFVNIELNIFAKLQFVQIRNSMVRAAVIQNSFPNSYYKIT